MISNSKMLCDEHDCQLGICWPISVLGRGKMRPKFSRRKNGQEVSDKNFGIYDVMEWRNTQSFFNQ